MYALAKQGDELELSGQWMRRLLRRLEPRVRRQFVAAILRARRSRTLDQLAELVVTGRIQEALASVSAASAASIADVANVVFVEAGQAVAEAVSRRSDVIVTFDQTNFRAVRRMQEARLRLIREFTQEQLSATREALRDGIERGANPRQQARVFRESIGLTQRQQRAVNNYRRLLREGSSEALTRQLRDRRFDPTVRRAVAGDIALTDAQIDRMVSRYGERFLRFRSEVIARTESLRAVHEGSEESLRQSVDDGTIEPGSVRRAWLTASDARVRDPHAPMHGQTRQVGEPFLSGNGTPLRHPGDPSAPASETVQCRCVVTTRLRLAA